MATRGVVFDRDSAKRVASVVRIVEHQPRDNRGKPRRPRVSQLPPVFEAVVIAVHNDYLEVKRVDAEHAPRGEAFQVAKPTQLRHDKKWYPDITDLTTVDEQEIEVTDGTDTEELEVRPPYIPHPAPSGKEPSLILVAPVARGLGAVWEDEEDPPVEHVINFIDLNIDGRVWGLKE